MPHDADDLESTLAGYANGRNDEVDKQELLAEAICDLAKVNIYLYRANKQMKNLLTIGLSIWVSMSVFVVYGLFVQKDVREELSVNAKRLDRSSRTIASVVLKLDGLVETMKKVKAEVGTIPRIRIKNGKTAKDKPVAVIEAPKVQSPQDATKKPVGIKLEIQMGEGKRK